uniref:TldE-like protein (PmbA) n=1 Tax=uncultured marine thaumarchaeote KM3_73_F02 TaxID=1456268 RepID=A0A075HPH0_9ARCH|nr:TldE-like protein (pmbA) [uncultured marine thaumarchaeote KM3_73_F02]
MKLLNLDELIELGFSEATKAGVDDASILGGQSVERMIRFSNNNITVSKDIDNIFLTAYVTKGKRRIIGSTSNPIQRSLKSFIKNLVDTCASLEPTKSYTQLPNGPFRYKSGKNFDIKIRDNAIDLIGLTKQAIDQGLNAGAERVSGTLTSNHGRQLIRTSAGVQGENQSTSLTINVRAFADDSASGHGLSCSSNTRKFDAEDAGRTAGEYAKRSIGAKVAKDGIYDLILAPTVTADIVQHVGSFASAFSVETGSSFLANKMGQTVATDSFTLRDYGLIKNGLGGHVFDDEGVPTKETTIINKGVLESYLHNSATAATFNTKTTGNAGLISPHPWNLVVDKGSLDTEEMVSQVKMGMFITNNWYTRFQNLRGGEYSTVPRDAAFLIEKGEIKYPISGMRISDTIPRQLLNIKELSEERKWIEWWEVNVPILAPYMLLKDVPITCAVR